MRVSFCGYVYTELHEYLPVQFESCWLRLLQTVETGMWRIWSALATPLKVNELLDTVEMMEYTITRRRKKVEADSEGAHEGGTGADK